MTNHDDYVVSDARGGQAGLTKLEHFTALAMQGLCASGMYLNRQVATEVGGVEKLPWIIGYLATEIAVETIKCLNDTEHIEELKKQLQ